MFKYNEITLNADLESLINTIKQFPVTLIRLPNITKAEINQPKEKLTKNKIYKICQLTNYATSQCFMNKTIVFLGPLHFLPFIYKSIDKKFKFQDLIAIKLKKVQSSNFLPNEHLGLMIFSTKKYLPYNEVKVPFEFCKACKNTLKDYGGKTHLLNRNGTRISDVWKHVPVNINDEFPSEIIKLIKNLILNDKKNEIGTFSLMKFVNWEEINCKEIGESVFEEIFPKTNDVKSVTGKIKTNVLLNQDVLIGLKKIPNRSVNLALVDPPYNLAVNYGKFRDSMKDHEYVNWVKNWTEQIYRVLRRDGTLLLINIPQWTLELFPHLLSKMKFRGWIVWDAWSIPHGKVIPAHYPILCFSKSNSKKITKKQMRDLLRNEIDVVLPLNRRYCIRSRCINHRTMAMQKDRRPLTDLWTDIHRIRHNSFRYNHPTLMPQKLAKRLITVFSSPNDIVLDCFNGVGTTTLVAQKLGRRFIGIEKNHTYYNTAIKRHKMLSEGKDPFERKNAKSTSLNKGYRTIKHQKYTQKKILQLEVKKIAKKIGRCPTPDELEKLGNYPLKYYHDNFRDWAEITVATHRTGLRIK